MRIDVLTIFPEIFESFLGCSLLSKALEKGRLKIVVHDIRESTGDRHRTVDDEPFGGGPGMVMRPDVVVNAVERIAPPSVKPSREVPWASPGGRYFPCPIVFLTPQGSLFSQKLARDLAELGRIVVVCGRYEGVDERAREEVITHEVSIGDYVLSGGEVPAMVLIDAIARLVPGVIKEPESHQNDSFATGLLEHPHYTRPRDFRGRQVPEVLLSGDHGRIQDYRRKASIRRTLERRPDLFRNVELDARDREMLAEILRESEQDDS